MVTPREARRQWAKGTCPQEALGHPALRSHIDGGAWRRYAPSGWILSVSPPTRTSPSRTRVLHRCDGAGSGEDNPRPVEQRRPWRVAIDTVGDISVNVRHRHIHREGERVAWVREQHSGVVADKGGPLTVRHRCQRVVCMAEINCGAPVYDHACRLG